MTYVELHCKSNFTFLEGASHPDELVEQAHLLGYAGIALTDVNSVAGVVRGHTAAKDLPFKYIIGSELRFTDGPSIVVWPCDRAAYGRLCRLLTLGRSRAPKGECELRWSDLEAYADGLLAGFLPQLSNEKHNEEEIVRVNRFRDVFGERGYLLAHSHLGVDDRERLSRVVELSKKSKVPIVAGGDVHYHLPERMLMHDLVSAIKHGKTIPEIAAIRPPNAQWAMRTVEQIQHLFRDVPGAIERTNEIAERCRFSLDDLRYEYPIESAPVGMKPIDFLKQLVSEGAQKRYPDRVPEKIVRLIDHELELIEDLHYEAYFLTVWDLVRFARSRNILCQGRGSAANSVVCFCLGVTSVDPNELDLLFERFISRERGEAPDIDVDFEHQRREEVLQYIYEKYGRDRAGMTAVVTTYRIRSAARETAKALGISLDRIDALAKVIDGRSGHESLAERCRSIGFDPDSEIGKRFLYLVQHLVGFPRHLSQHTGGMVMTQGLLCELCPIENAAMDGRTVIQWNKDDLDALGILKVDCLALGMLSAIHRSFDLLAEHYDRSLTLASVPQGDADVYEMICRADTLGVFQIESRAQMSMLPRLQPRCYYDLVIEVAIVRPGPIQGQMVHPYLNARQTGIQPSYPTPEIAEVLSKTLGVPIFQEQAMRLAVVAAGFTPGEADQLRRAMAAWRRPGLIDQFRRKLIDGMLERGLSQQFAESVFMQLRGFGEYGFPESHAASFALLVYVSCWLKHHYPAVFCAAMLNSQPLGFYAPSQLVQDAIRHNVEVLQPDINRSHWDCTLETIEATVSRTESFTAKTGTDENALTTLPLLQSHSSLDIFHPSNLHPPLGRVEAEGRGFGEGASSVSNRCPPLAALDPPASGRVKMGRDQCPQVGELERGSGRERALGSSSNSEDSASTKRFALRLGWRMLEGLSEAIAQSILDDRNKNGPFRDSSDLVRRTQIGQGTVTLLAKSGVLESITGDRRAALWQSLAIEKSPKSQPLFDFSGTDADEIVPLSLQPMQPLEEIYADYATTGLSLRGHPMSFCRDELDALRVTTAADLSKTPNGRPVRVAGLVLLRQRPSTAKGITFVTLEDETGTVNLVIKPAIWDYNYLVCKQSNAWLVHGVLEHRQGVIHVVVGRIEDLSSRVKGLKMESRDFR